MSDQNSNGEPKETYRLQDESKSPPPPDNPLRDYLRIIRRPNVWIMGLSLFLLITFVSSWLFLLPLYLREMGAGEGAIGTAYVFFVLAFSVLQIPGGYMADKMGRKKIIAWPTVLLPILYLAAAFTGNWIMVMVFLTLGNLIQGLQVPALYSLMAESVEEKDSALGFSILEISLAVGFTIGPIIGYAFIKSPFLGSIPQQIFGPGGKIIQLMMLFTGLVLIPCTFLRFLLKDSARHEDFQVNSRQVIKAFNKNLVWLLVSFIFYGLMVDTTFYGQFIPLYAKDVIKMSDGSIQIMFALGGLSAIIFNLFIGGAVKKMGSRKALIAGMLGHCLLFIPWLFARSAPVAILIYFPTYVFLQLSYIAHDTMMSDLTDIETRSTIMGVFFMVPGVLGSLAPLIGSRMVEGLKGALPFPYPLAGPFFLAVLYGILAVAFLLPIRPNKI